MSVYYNENDPYCARWLQNLRDAGYIPRGFIDDRSIKEVQGEDTHEISHFFAGIGGWPLALSLAGWPEDRPVWTGSCPCQPFSNAGLQKGMADERHLWPDWLELIAECRPPTIFGEQVASKDGRIWLAGVRSDLEALGYVVGAADLCAASVEAPHIRQRLWWVANTKGEGLEVRIPYSGGLEAPVARFEQSDRWATEPDVGRVAHGIPSRVGKLRALGNAIVPQVAAEFIAAYLEATHPTPR